MGVWGAGLYSGDFAADLRSSIKSVVRLPFEGDKLAQLLCDLEPSSAGNPDDEDHTTFWLVVADQFAKYGVRSDLAHAKALEIIDSGADLRMLQKLGIDSTLARRRERMLADLKMSLLAPQAPIHKRSLMKKPQGLLFDAGDVLIYPTSLGRCRQKLPPRIHPVPAWRQDGWGAAIILQAGLAFEFLAWYRPLVLDTPRTEKPGLAQVRIEPRWSLRRAGTCNSMDAKSLELERIGRYPLSVEKLRSVFPDMKPGVRAALDNTSIARDLAAAHHPAEAYVIRTAFPDTPEGEEKFQATLRQLEEQQSKMTANTEKIQESQNKRRPKLTSLDEILA